MATSETPSSYYLRWGPRMLREAVNNLVNLVCKIQPLAGDGLIRQDGPLGRSFSVVLPDSTGQSVLDHPFQIIKQNITFGSNSYTQIGVTSNSHLFNSEDKETYEEENEDWGLLADDNDQFDFNWVYTDTLIPGDKIWLQISLDADQVITGIQLRFGFVGGAGNWQYYPDPIEIGEPEGDARQVGYNQIIGEVTYFEEDPRSTDVTWTTQDGTKFQITQLLHTNLMMTTAHTTDDADDPGLPLLVAIPWNGPGTSTDGIADEINSDDDLMTPWSLGPVSESGSTVAFSVVDISSGNNLAVQVLDGHVNFEYPSGMGFGDFTLTISSSTTVYLIITYNTTTLAITSRSITTGSTPDSTQGTVYIELADVTVGDGALEIEQLHEGNINMALIYGAFNGAPAIIPLRALSNWAAVT
jgi:hypothetical protein